MKKGNVVILALFGIAILLGLGALWFLLSQNVSLKDKLTQEVSTLTTPTPTMSVLPTTVVTPTPTPISQVQIVVVFESEVNFPANAKTQLQARVVNPLVDYYSMEIKDAAVSVKVKINTGTNKTDYPYLIEYILASGANGGQVVTKTGAEIAWWYPECLSNCNLSAEYKAKYPEVAALVN